MINGGMAEAQQGFAVLDDVDEETIQRFIEWAYKGYYTAGRIRRPRRQKTEQSSIKKGKITKMQVNNVLVGDAVSAVRSTEEPPSPLPPAVDPVEDELGEWVGLLGHENLGKEMLWGSSQLLEAIGKDHDQVIKRKNEFKLSFLRYDYKVRRNAIPLPRTRGNLGPTEKYVDVFLSHARLFVFAEMYDIQILKILALEELHSTLAHYTLFDSRTDDIVALLRYVYTKTSGEEGKNSGGGGWELRKLLMDYVGLEMRILTKSRSLKDLMFENEDLLGDFMKMVSLRVD